MNSIFVSSSDEAAPPDAYFECLEASCFLCSLGHMNSSIPHTSEIWARLKIEAAVDGFLNGGGLMADAIRKHDWAATSLGPIPEWPTSLMTTLRIMLTSRQPISVFWGPELLMFYNEAYAPFLADRHGRALGQPFEVIWSDVWKE